MQSKPVKLAVIANFRPTLEKKFVELQKRLDIYPIHYKPNFLRWWSGLVRQQVCHIPSPAPLQQRELLLSQLYKTDPRGLFAGKMVGCCMEPQDVGAACAWHGHESPDGAFWVVERFGEIIAVAWVWRHADSLVIDCIDVLKVGKDKYVAPRERRIYPMFLQAAQSVIGQQGVARVYVGVSLRRTGWDKFPHKLRPFPSPAVYAEGKGDDSVIVALIAGA